MPRNAAAGRPIVQAIVVAAITIIAMYLISFALGALTGASRLPRISPYVLVSLNLLVPILVGATWLRLRTDHVMSNQQRLLFAAGVAFTNAVFALAISYALTRAAGLPVAHLVPISAMFVVLLHFVAAYLLVWLLTLRSGGGALNS